MKLWSVLPGDLDRVILRHFVFVLGPLEKATRAGEGWGKQKVAGGGYSSSVPCFSASEGCR